MASENPGLPTGARDVETITGNDHLYGIAGHGQTGSTNGSDLNFAKRLGQLLNVPLVACPPNPGDEFTYPAGVRDNLSASDNRNQLSSWRPGWAIMARTGGPIAAVDVDTKNGADVEKTRQLLDGLNVRIFAEDATPSGGAHFYIAGHPELPSCSNLTGWPGIDILSFGRLVFLPAPNAPNTTAPDIESSSTTSTHSPTAATPTAPKRSPNGLLSDAQAKTRSKPRRHGKAANWMPDKPNT